MSKAVVRGVAVLATAVLLTAAALQAELRAPAPALGAGHETLSPERLSLQRCREEGEGALGDRTCAAVWARVRAGFLERRP